MLFRRFRFALPALLAVALLCAPQPPAQAGPFDKLKKKLDKFKDKADEANAKAAQATAQVTQPLQTAQQKALEPVTQAQQAVQNAQNQALTPVRDAQNALSTAQNQATVPVRDAQNAVANARNQALVPVTKLRSTADGVQSMAMQPAVQARQVAGMAQGQIGAVKGQLSQLANVQNLIKGNFGKDAILRGYGLNSQPSADGQSLRLIGKVKTPAERARAGQIAARSFPGAIVNQITVSPVAAKATVKSSVKTR